MSPAAGPNSGNDSDVVEFVDTDAEFLSDRSRRFVAGRTGAVPGRF
ncbi:hypothetical protein GLA29479_1740 [Lysobacter antibioticus]|nr:hypothetical protein GLA29479_1740 [Lysobacter antibioticus]